MNKSIKNPSKTILIFEISKLNVHQTLKIPITKIINVKYKKI